MDAQLNKLCSLCKRMEFVVQGSHIVSVQTSIIRHAAAFKILQESALRGCHVCTLFASGLKLSQLRDGQRLCPYNEITVQYFPYYLAQPYDYGERLEVYCGKVSVPLYLERVDECDTTILLRSIPESVGPRSWAQGALQSPQSSPRDLTREVGPNARRHYQTCHPQVSPSSEMVIEQVKHWIASCNSHPNCRINHSNKLPLRVIDVGPADGSQDPRLTIGEGKFGDYVTLSYRWSSSGLLTTKSTTLMERVTGIPMRKFPQTLHDAVTVTRLLGKRYLWIDALCILQDSSTDWDTQSACMDEIYGNAWLNISANVAENAEAGFLNDRNLLEIRNCEHPTLIHSTSPQRRLICPYIWSTRYSISNNTLTSRGWIFQEKFYSTRILHFLDHEVLWECKTVTLSERCPIHLLNPNASDLATWRKIGLLRHNLLLEINDAFDDVVTGAIHDTTDAFPAHRFKLWHLLASSFDPWYAIVEKYSQRSFTILTDRLPAVSSLARMTQCRAVTKATYIAGLWLEDLSYGLGWSSNECNSSTTIDLPFIGPSFSWVSAHGSVRFHKAPNPKSEKELQIINFTTTPARDDPFGAVEFASYPRGLGETQRHPAPDWLGTPGCQGNINLDSLGFPPRNPVGFSGC